MTAGPARPLVGAAAILVVLTVVGVALSMFRGDFGDTVKVTVLAPRAGLVMYPDADVKLLGVSVGSVTALTPRADGTAELELAIRAGELDSIPADVTVAIASTTVFGAKYVQFDPPARPSGARMYPGQVLGTEDVTVEINTVFEQLTSVLARLEPQKLNETLGAVAAATDGRGHDIGRMLGDLERFLASIEPALPALHNDLALAAPVANAYADAGQALIDTASHASSISRTLTDQHDNLDAFLVSLIGLADVGEPVLATNREPLATVLELLVPTTELTDEYRDSLTCSLDGFAFLAESEPVDVPGLGLSASFLWGTEPYTYPRHLPKVAASGGPQCSVLPVPYEGRPPFVVADVGANPFERGNQTVLLNPDTMPALLFDLPTVTTPPELTLPEPTLPGPMPGGPR